MLGTQIPSLVAQSPGREAALAWASLAQRFPASSLLARDGAGCGSVGDVPGAWLRDQEGRRGSEEAVPGPSVFPSGEPGVSGFGSLHTPGP